MKKVFSSHSEVCHVFAQNSQNEGSANNVFFEGNRLYSYGYHYVLAEFLNNDVVFLNNSGYSSSTWKHIGHAMSALSNKTIIYYSSTFGAVANEIKKNIRKLANARKPEIYINNILRHWSNYEAQSKILDPILKNRDNHYNGYQFALIDKRKAGYKSILRIVNQVKNNVSDYKEVLKVEALKKLKKRRKEENKRLKENLLKFNSRKIHYFSSEYAYLRINPNSQNIETSQGANVPIKEAKILFKMIQAKKDIKGFKIGYYTVISINGSLKIGCHNIDMSSVNEIGKLL